MGGGVGVSMHGSHVIATEKTMFAMPETAIGLFPDVGGGWLLAQLPLSVGLWLALTGDRLKAYDLLKIGLANFYLDSNKTNDLKNSLINSETLNKENVSKIINQFSSENSFIKSIHIEKKHNMTPKKYALTKVTIEPIHYKLGFY